MLFTPFFAKTPRGAILLAVLGGMSFASGTMGAASYASRNGALSPSLTEREWHAECIHDWLRHALQPGSLQDG